MGRDFYVCAVFSNSVEMIVLRLYVAAGLLVIIRAVNSQCSTGQTVTFSRWSGVAPDRAAPVFVYAARGDEPSLTAACLARCKDLQECHSVTLVHGKGHCLGLAADSATVLRIENDATYFEKICVDLDKGCSNRWWAVESTPGYRLQSENKNLNVILNVTARDCYAALFSRTNPQTYKSAQWVASDQDFDAEIIRKWDNMTGNCVLNSENKFTEPESYRVANYHTLYIENQCQHDYPPKIDRCSYEEYYNQTLKHVELTLGLMTKDKCKKSCEVEQHFVCRGFTWRQRDASDALLGECGLHSQDLLTIGSWLMTRASNAVYYRRVICLDISVECGQESLSLRYRPRSSFRGRVYVPGHGERCSARPSEGIVVLTLPYYGECDVNFAHAISKGPDGFINRTMAYVTVMIQSNDIIQTAGDRWVRVGCSPNHAAEQQVQAAISVTVNTNPSTIDSVPLSISSDTGASAVLNASSWQHPRLSMYVVRPDGERSDSVVALGEILELRIETVETSEIEAYHLVASSRLGDSSVLLLDSQGCPTGQVDFPQFTRQWVGGIQRLWARFKAFRFPTSHVVRFSIMVRFCETKCILKKCGTSRSTRETEETNPVKAQVREQNLQTAGVLAQSGPTPCGELATSARVPLELEFVVGSKDVISSDTLVRADHRSNIPDEILTASTLGSAGVVCMHEALVVSLALCWLAVQLLLLLGCCVMLRRYRSLAETNLQKDYQSFDNVGFDTTSTHRRVHWPDQNVDILHVN